jgi:hypothetical protein
MVLICYLGNTEGTILWCLDRFKHAWINMIAIFHPTILKAACLANYAPYPIEKALQGISLFPQN